MSQVYQRHCKGVGHTDVKIVFGEVAEATLVGICPLCGEHNGVFFYYPDKMRDLETELDEHRAPCMNHNCPGEYVSWVDLADVDH